MSERPPLLDRIGNRLTRHFPAERVKIAEDKSVVTFTFDDVPASAQEDGARILSSHGVKGTFYIAGGLTGTSDEEQTFISKDGQRSLVSDGHEIGCHTYTHANVRTLNVQSLRSEIVRNDGHQLEIQPGLRTENFAYPYTNATPRARKELLRRFKTCRGGQLGINRGLIDPGYLHTVEIRPDYSEEWLLSWIDDVRKQPGWLIFFTHDVAEAPSQYGCYTHVLKNLVEHALELELDVLPVRDALQKLNLSEQIDNRFTR
ncbi:polysaccharide deacetylase family protein [Roseibium sp. SCP14]|uniref:polysaccharide deacetylase family protein n=1 Tax=Roseibium sp. SCP14 TaxID=3141375 RepID=UPI003338FE90